MNVQCSTAELPALLPMLAGLKTSFHLTVTDGQQEKAVVFPAPASIVTPASTVVAADPAADVQPASAEKAAPVGRRWYSTAEVSAIFGHKAAQTTVQLMARAKILPVHMNPTAKRGGNGHYYDAEKVDALKRAYDNTLAPKDAASLMGDKSVVPIHHHTERRRITPTEVAGKVRYRLEDLEQLMKQRKIA